MSGSPPGLGRCGAFLHGQILSFVVLALIVSPPTASGAPPNIVLVLADDLGWTDLGATGSRYYETPNLDRLRSEGMLFTDAYSNGPNCAPTRASLMSGQYSPRTGVYTVGSSRRGQESLRRTEPVANRAVLDPSVVTIAEALSAAGYATASIGKWHLGADPDAGPRAQGFQVNLAGDARGSPPRYFSPYRLAELPDGPEGEYLTDRLTDEAIRFLRDRSDRPFFLYVPHFAVHTPIQAKADHVARAKERAPVGGHDDPVYAAMIASLDDSVGRILAALEADGLAENTVVIFTSDNGGLGGYARAGVVGGRDISDNAPLRGGKGMLYEGGIRVPLIVRWPGRVAPGSLSTEPVITVDLYPTLLEIAGVATPPDALLDGESLVPLLVGAGARSIRREALFWHFPAYLEASRSTWRTTPAGAVRAGRYKLIEFFETGAVELYDLAADLGEEHDIASERLDVTESLVGSLARWRRDLGASLPVRKSPAPRLARAHAHNDYYHERPLLDALDHGFASVEADVFLVDGKLLVGHSRSELEPSRTLEALYLGPLAGRVAANGGGVHAGGGAFTLLVDFKAQGAETWAALRAALEPHREMLTTFEGDSVRPGAVTVVVSGDRPWEVAAAEAERLAGLDGRLEDLDSGRSPALMPLVSDHWGRHFAWRGDGEMPEGDRAKLEGVVASARASGYRLRFWATPERWSVWRALALAGVDHINTDDLAGLERFLRLEGSGE